MCDYEGQLLHFLQYFSTLFFSFLHLVAEEKRRRSALPWAGGESLYSLHSSPPVCLTIIFILCISSFFFSVEVPQYALQSSSTLFVFFTFHLLSFPLKSLSLLYKHLHGFCLFYILSLAVHNLLHNNPPSF